MVGTRIFIIRFQNGKRYIFESELLSSEVYDYLNELDLQWVQNNLPVSLIGVVPDCGCDVDLYVLKYMKHLGIDEVRGGSWTAVELTQEDIKKINKKIKKRKNPFCLVKKFVRFIKKRVHRFFTGKPHICETSFSDYDITSVSSESEVEYVSNS